VLLWGRRCVCVLGAMHGEGPVLHGSGFPQLGIVNWTFTSLLIEFAQSFGGSHYFGGLSDSVYVQLLMLFVLVFSLCRFCPRVDAISRRMRLLARVLVWINHASKTMPGT
jgi:hypothetical protein